MESPSFVREALEHAIERSIYYEKRRRVILDPESDEYEYVVGILDMWNTRIQSLGKQYARMTTVE